MKPLVVGFESYNYGAARNCYAPVEGVEYVKLRRAPLEWTPGKESRGFDRIFMPVPPNPKVDLVHLWNRVSVGRTPWGVSFESTLPYLNPTLHERMIALQTKRLHSERCRFIVAISDHARAQLKENLPEDDWSQIQHKVTTIYPDHRQEPRRSDFPEVIDSGPLRLLFVGVTFFGKGGEAVLRAVERLGAELNLELTVVSPVAGGDYGGTPPADVDVERVRERLMINPRVAWHQSLPNEEVLREIERHHVGLLPTFADTFGYAVLEFLGLGLPSIVSNVQAIPEFTGPETGWSVELPLDDRGIWVGRQSGVSHRRNRYFEAVDSVESQLEQIIRQIREKPEVLPQLSLTSRQRFEAQFDNNQRAAELASVYRKAVAV